MVWLTNVRDFLECIYENVKNESVMHWKPTLYELFFATRKKNPKIQYALLIKNMQTQHAKQAIVHKIAFYD